MKVIDLMYGVLPDKIKVNGKIWTLCKNEYHICDDYGYDYWLEHKDDKFEEDVDLSDEIEIIEDTPKEEIQVLSRYSPPKEDKKIKRIQSCGDNLYSEYIGQWLIHKENYSEYDELLMNKINEIIDRLNGE